VYFGCGALLAGSSVSFFVFGFVVQ
jgi:hypothetical protein